MQRAMVIIIALLLPVLAAAQEWTEHPVVSGFAGAYCVHAEDVDGDGDVDVLGAASGVNDITWWENLDGSGLNWSEHIVDGEFDGANHVYAEDVDGDGDMDVLGTAFGVSDITWWENLDGTGLNWSEHPVDGEFDGARSVYAVDMDDDGDMDVLGAAEEDDITWWENLDGTGLNWSEHAVDGESDGAYFVYAEDMDDDGDMDVFGADRDDGTITWWENLDGTGLNWSEHIVDSELDGAKCVYVEDVDGDGDMDVFGAGAEDIVWWENIDGTGLNWAEHTLVSELDGLWSVHVEDVDSDGDMDLLGAADMNDVIIWWENLDGSGLNWSEHMLDGEFEAACSVYAEDVDGDGDMDVLGAAYNDFEISWWENPFGVGVDEYVAFSLPDEYALISVYPNPFNSATTISVSLPSAADLNVVVFDVVGRQVATLAGGIINAGTHTFTFDASGLASGMYFIRVTVPGHMNEIQKVMLVR